VVLQQRGELLAGGVAVERLDRVAEIHLVLQETLGRRGLVREITEGAHDEEPGPGDVVLPQLAHVGPQVLRLRTSGDGQRGQPDHQRTQDERPTGSTDHLNLLAGG
jgi:hypothetical protein